MRRHLLAAAILFLSLLQIANPTKRPPFSHAACSWKKKPYTFAIFRATNKNKRRHRSQQYYQYNILNK
ncbi:hypothetical protein, partial [Stenotrophomonas maltophilia]|uniref:hypothetical protein n=1 Tax=Stenotrophomonas maltophilia TaxID=40324 RepID=UPI001C8BA088